MPKIIPKLIILARSSLSPSDRRRGDAEHLRAAVSRWTASRAERGAQALGVARDVGQQPQLDLAVVGGPALSGADPATNA